MSQTKPRTDGRRSSRRRDFLSRLRANMAPEKGSFLAAKDKDHDSEQIDEAHLGPYANERQMPWWLVRVLKSGDKVSTRSIFRIDTQTSVSMDLKAGETPCLVPTLALLSASCHPNFTARYCSPHVHHVAKERREGSFCGYRNIQMLVSYIRNAKAQGHQHFDKEPLPSIFQLQGMIEHAWDQGYNTSSRNEVGTLQMTRKFIGTSEVEALFLSLDVPVVRRAFVATAEKAAHELLMDYVARYFEFAGMPDPVDKSASPKRRQVLANLVGAKPPLYFQRPGHSMTIVGISEDIKGSRSLVIFDPKYKPSSRLKELATNCAPFKNVTGLLEAHLYDASYLSRYDAFELVQLGDATTIPPRPV